MPTQATTPWLRLWGFCRTQKTLDFLLTLWYDYLTGKDDRERMRKEPHMTVIRRDGRILECFAVINNDSGLIFGAVVEKGRCIARTEPIYLDEDEAIDAAFLLAKHL